MKRILVLYFTAVILFNTVAFAEQAAYGYENEVLAVFSANVEYGIDYTAINLSEISGMEGSSLSYNRDTGFLYWEDSEKRLYFKLLDDSIRIDGTKLVLEGNKGEDISLPYRLTAFTYICSRNGQSDMGKSTAGIAEAVLKFPGSRAHFILRKNGTSSQIIDGSNIGEYLTDKMILVNKSNMLDRNYIPPDLVNSKPSRGRSTIAVRLNGEAMKQLNQMLEAAYSEGVSEMVITSAFRTFDKQTSLFNNKTNILSRSMSRKAAVEEASKVVAIPGSSEHQTGLAVDICNEKIGLTSDFANTKQGKWLNDNSWKFGFVVRYPLEKTEITGIIYEPWHVRYVGRVHAEIMKSSDMCLEEYVEYLKGNEVTFFKDSSGKSFGILYLGKEEIDSRGMELYLNNNSPCEISRCTRDSYILTIEL